MGADGGDDDLSHGPSANNGSEEVGMGIDEYTMVPREHGLILREWRVPLPLPQDQERVQSPARWSMKQYFFLDSRDHPLMRLPLVDVRKGAQSWVYI